MNYKTRAPFQNAAYVEGQRNFTYFDRSLTSGLTDVVIESPGDFLYIDQASTGAVSVELNMRQGGTLAPILLAAGGSIECDFASFKLTAAAQLNKSVRVVVGNGARIKGGANVNASSMSVSVVDGGLIRSLANQAFIASAATGAVGSTYPNFQLWNPANSTKNLYLEKFGFSSSVSQNVIVGAGSTALATLASAAYIQSKLFSGADGQAQVRTECGGNSFTSSYFYQTIVASANLQIDFELREPIIVPPGYGVVCYGQTLSSSLTGYFEWYEQ